MKRIFSLLVFLFAFATISFAQPGDPGGDPDQCGQVGSWTLHASASSISSGDQVTITATLDNPQPGGASAGSITVTAGSPACITTNNMTTVTRTILCGATEVEIGTYTLTDNGCFSQMSKSFNISGYTGGHSGGTGVAVQVVP